MSSIQEQFDSVKSGDFVLPAGEYEGPLKIDRPCTINGSKSTLWASCGLFLVVDHPMLPSRIFALRLLEIALMLRNKRL